MFSWLRKLFKKDAPRESETAEVLIPPSYDVEVSVWTDVGCLREVNEDCGRYVTPGHPEVVMSKGVLAFVVDGEQEDVHPDTDHTVMIDVNGPPASVYRDGKQLGLTPYSLQTWIGEHVELTLRRDGYKDYPLNFDVMANTKSFTETLQRR